MKEPLKIFLWGKEIGRLVWDSRMNNSYFTYNPDFLKEGVEIAPLTASVQRCERAFPCIWGKRQEVPETASVSS